MNDKSIEEVLELAKSLVGNIQMNKIKLKESSLVQEQTNLKIKCEHIKQMKETNEKKEKLVQDFNRPLENIAMFREATKVSSTMRTFGESYIAPLMEMKIPLENLTNQDFEKIKELNESINKKLENSLLRKTLDTSTVELKNFIDGNILNVTNSATFDENKDRKNLATKQILESNDLSNEIRQYKQFVDGIDLKKE